MVRYVKQCNVKGIETITLLCATNAPHTIVVGELGILFQQLMNKTHRTVSGWDGYRFLRAE